MSSLLFTCRSTCNSSTVTLDTSSLMSPPSTPVRQAVASVSPYKHSNISPSPPLLSSHAQPQRLHNPQLAGFIAESCSRPTTCLNSNCSNVSPVQPMVVMSDNRTPSVAAANETTATVDIEVKRELNNTFIIPDSPPIDVAQLVDDIVDFCESPPMFSSPAKQPLTSTQVANDCEMQQLNNSSSVDHAAEALSITEAVKEEQHNTVVSLSSQHIVLPSNPTICDQIDSTVNVATDESPSEPRHNLRKRDNKQGNIRYTKTRQHNKQEQVQ